MIKQVELVDESGSAIGAMEKLEAHQEGGHWHRAISVFLFNSQGQLLIQKRSAGKYHFPNLWANSCCSHPEPGETTERAARRTCLRELGIEPSVTEVSVFRYEALDDITGLTEREHDHLMVGRWDDELVPNPNEVQELRWVSIADLRREIEEEPERFTPWLTMILKSEDFVSLCPMPDQPRL